MYDGQKMICSIPEEEYPLALEIAYKIARSELVAMTSRGKAEVDLSILKEKTVEIENQSESLNAARIALKAATGKIDDAGGILKTMEDAVRELVAQVLNMTKLGDRSIS